ncbi:SSUH2 [Cordylochernes scorpioides]|uniref:SSUH2 n=1 Tax=Cordylochernes scorpioides TaxID=51811 RepID=A0ABY6K9C9_9ARAC|nr:SSUH2 [Cordylochernes scorpioides]
MAPLLPLQSLVENHQWVSSDTTHFVIYEEYADRVRDQVRLGHESTEVSCKAKIGRIFQTDDSPIRNESKKYEKQGKKLNSRLEKRKKEKERISMISPLTQDQVREALEHFLSEHCCYGKKPVEDMLIGDMSMTSCFRYTLETFGEQRKTYRTERSHRLDDDEVVAAVLHRSDRETLLFELSYGNRKILYEFLGDAIEHVGDKNLFISTGLSELRAVLNI